MKLSLIGSPFVAIGLALVIGMMVSSPLPVTKSEIQQQRPTLTPIPRPTLTPHSFELTPIAASSSLLSSIHGIIFEDLNHNGRRDESESFLGNGWFKVTGGGQWFACETAGDDGTFGVVVQPGTYYIIPVNIRGYRATTKRITVTVTSDASVANNIGYAIDPKAEIETCDQYHP